MTTKASLKAYIDPSNEVARISHKEKIFQYLKMTKAENTAREISKSIGLSYEATRKRISDLYKVDLVVIVGEKEEQGNNNSIYKINETPALFRNERKSNLELLEEAVRKCTDQFTREAIMDEFERLKRIKNGKA